MFGGGDWGRDRLIPDLMRAALAGEAAVVRNPLATRPWQHVLNPLSGYLLLAQSLWEDPGRGEGWNFGPTEEDARTVGWVVNRLAELWGDGLDWREPESGDGVREARYLKLDSSKARQELGWTPTWDLDTGLGAIVEWYQAYRGGGDVREATLDQIRAFSRG